MISTSPTKLDIEAWLSQEMIAKGGGVFTPADDWWRPDRTAVAANVGEAKYAVQEAARPWLIAALAYYAKEKAARSLKLLTYVLTICAGAGLDVLNDTHALAIRNRLSKSDFSSLRAFLKYWREEYLLAVCPSEQVIMALYDLKPSGISRPCPVESMDPTRGPFTTLETQALFDWVNDAYSNDRLTIERFIYIRLLIATGCRIRQIQQLVFGDIDYYSNPPVINMPKAKQNEFEYRSSFQSFALAPDLYNILRVFQRVTLQSLNDERLGVNWNKALPNVPLFRTKGGDKSVVIVDDSDLYLLEKGPNEKFHKHDGSMKALLWGLHNDPGFPVSERTGEKIHLGSHRFRHTLATDMSRMGYGPHAIAYALTHKGVGTVGRYIKTSPELAKRIDDKMKSQLSLVINAFQGRLIYDPAEAINSDNVNKRIRSQSGVIATCGASGGCHLDAPVSCYTCSKFQPWREGPHEEVLERLKLRQQRAIEATGKNSDAAVSFDRPILAVMHVINKINEAVVDE